MKNLCLAIVVSLFASSSFADFVYRCETFETPTAPVTQPGDDSLRPQQPLKLVSASDGIVYQQTTDYNKTYLFKVSKPWGNRITLVSPATNITFELTIASLPAAGGYGPQVSGQILGTNKTTGATAGSNGTSADGSVQLYMTANGLMANIGCRVDKTVQAHSNSR